MAWGASQGIPGQRKQIIFYINRGNPMNHRTEDTYTHYILKCSLKALNIY